MLSNPQFAITQPYEYQLGKNLVYCNLLEHLILHMKITDDFIDVATDSVPKNKMSKERIKALEQTKDSHANFRLLSGDVLLTIVGSIGESCILKKPDGITFQRSVAFLRPGPNVDSLFLRTITETKAFQSELNGRKNSSAQAGVYLGELSIIPTQIPALREQKELGGFFDKLDSLIVLHQRELDKLKLLKKSLLQKMFI